MVGLLVSVVAALATGPVVLPGMTVDETDYPPAALRENREGTTDFRVIVDGDGVPRECVVVGSSKSADLDARTCSIVVARMRFKPALDVLGRAVSAPYAYHIAWKIDRQPSPLADLDYRTDLTLTMKSPIGRDGTPDICTMSAIGIAIPAATPCPPFIPANALPFLLGEPLANFTEIRTIVTSRPVGTQEPPLPPATKVAVAVRMRIHYDPVDSASSCVVIEPTIPFGLPIDPCATFRPGDLAAREPKIAADRAVGLLILAARRGPANDGAAGTPVPPPRR